VAPLFRALRAYDDKTERMGGHQRKRVYPEPNPDNPESMSFAIGGGKRLANYDESTPWSGLLRAGALTVSVIQGVDQVYLIHGTR
jgi:hypothetical protein